jgi:hypothetical protein
MSSGYGGGVYFGSNATMENCEITNNQANSGGGIYNSYVSSTIDSCLIQGNSANSGSGGGIFNDGGFAPRITNCTIRDNYASINGGGIFNDEKNDAVISGCTIVLNTATGRGGGIYSGQGSSSNTTYAEPEITNNVIANNWATWGGGLYCAAYSKSEIINCTIAGNTAATGGAGVYVVDTYSYTRIMNSILYGNVLDAGGHSDVYFNGPTAANLILLYNNFSMLDESWHNSGAPTRTGNIGVNAGFINYDGPDGDPLAGGDSDYHISETGGLVDQGVSSYTVSSQTVTLVAPDHDIEGNTRPQGGGVDLGAYESSLTAPIPTYDLTAVVSGGNGTLSPTSGTYDEGETVILTATPFTGYQVATWSGTSDDSSTASTNTVIMNSDKTVTVSFESIPVTQYSLTASVSGGNGAVSPTTGTYDDGETVILTATPDTGYYVMSWSGTDDDNSTAISNTVVMNSNQTVTVIFSCTDPNDADTDDDGILDDVEDANQNGIVDPGETDPCRVDTDDDGIQDGTEIGLLDSDIGGDTDTDVFIPDADPTTTTNPLDSDSDNDGVSDGEEDANHNGAMDDGETDPNESGRQKAMPWIPLLLLDE